MNVASGGDLIQDINHSIKTKIYHEQQNPRNEVSQEISIKKNSLNTNAILFNFFMGPLSNFVSK